MRRSGLRSVRAAAIAALLALRAAAALAHRAPTPLSGTTTRHPDQFGVDAYTVTVIPAESFTADKDTVTDYGTLVRDFGEDGPLGDVFSGHLYAGVSVPSGAVIDFIGLQAHDHFQGNDNIATLFYLDQFSGTTSGIVSIASTGHGSTELGTDYNTEPLGWRLVRNVHNALVLDVYIPGGDWMHRGGLRWVEIWWKRTVSPASPFPTFLDVPESDSGYQYVEALAASGITGGCGGQNFCPEAPLTRRQMAIFLAKALGLHWPM
jgi:hypothetical protein